MKNALSIDVEDWYHPEFVRKKVRESPKPQINESIDIILNLLKKYDVKATFFVVGEIIVKNPSLLHKIYDNGHEIGFHGMTHKPLWYLNPKDFDEELKKFKTLVQKIIGNGIKIFGFRAPSCSLNKNTKFALKSLVSNDYVYDSSILPMNLFKMGYSNTPRLVYRPKINNPRYNDENSKLIEFPLTTYQILKFQFPIYGGFFFRVMPYFIFKTLLNNINSKNQSFLLYFHPWEFYNETFRVKNVDPIRYFITYFGISRLIHKFEKLLRDFEFESISYILKKRYKVDLNS